MECARGVVIAIVYLALKRAILLFLEVVCEIFELPASCCEVFCLIFRFGSEFWRIKGEEQTLDKELLGSG